MYVLAQSPAPSTGTKADGVVAKTMVLKSSFAAIARVVRIYIRNLPIASVVPFRGGTSLEEGSSAGGARRGTRSQGGKKGKRKILAEACSTPGWQMRGALADVVGGERITGALDRIA